MKIVQINTTCGVGSTGKICVEISRLLTERKIENHILYSSKTNGYELGISCSNDRYIKWQALQSRVFGDYGFHSKAATQKMIRELDRIQPDVVHLHNIHGHDCDLEMLFQYFREKKTKLFWTFHDCWAFTAYCPYFTVAQCDKWQTGCEQCPQHRNHSFLLDRSKYLYQKKKELFLGLDLTIVTPSQWLADLVKQSFLKDYPVIVIHNGIDLTVFRPTESDFRSRYGCEKKKIVLGVAFDWGYRKGLDVFLALANRLDESYQCVLVGTNDEIDRQLPANVVSIHRTQNQKELAEIYTAADVFVNPTREENYPTVNMEAVACGTPVITFRTGGSPEMLDETCGAIVRYNDAEALEKEIVRVCTENPFSTEQCLKKSREFDMHARFQEYVKLYQSIRVESDQAEQTTIS